MRNMNTRSSGSLPPNDRIVIHHRKWRNDALTAAFQRFLLFRQTLQEPKAPAEYTAKPSATIDRSKFRTRHGHGLETDSNLAPYWMIVKIIPIEKHLAQPYILYTSGCVLKWGHWWNHGFPGFPHFNCQCYPSFSEPSGIRIRCPASLLIKSFSSWPWSKRRGASPAGHSIGTTPKITETRLL